MSLAIAAQTVCAFAEGGTADNGTESISVTEEYTPPEFTAVNIAVNTQLVQFSTPARYMGENIIVPMPELARALELPCVLQNGVYTVSSLSASISFDTIGNAFYIETGTLPRQVYNAPCAAQDISGVLFVPVSIFADAFGLELITDTTQAVPTLYIGTPAPNNNYYVNRAGLSSETDYLVWISKSEYKVRVYLGAKGGWNQVNEFTCGIGAPSTPTCEGTYKYYQAQSKWDYKTYYVGPVMRFNGGYAIHSTLLYPNGTPKDNRVGIKLSHGCIRLRPDDINWMFYYVPLRTTIHITG